jgi:hypothetical protein
MAAPRKTVRTSGVVRANGRIIALSSCSGKTEGRRERRHHEKSRPGATPSFVGEDWTIPGSDTDAPPFKWRFSAGDYLALREQQTQFEESATYSDRSVIYSDGVSSELFFGVLAAPALARLLSSLLFGVSAADALTFVTVSGALVLVALAACVVPARRPVGIQPAAMVRKMAVSTLFPATRSVYAGISEEMVSRKPLGSVTSNARLFHSVSCGSELSWMPAPLARTAISSTFCVVDMNNRMPMPFFRSRPFFQSS